MQKTFILKEENSLRGSVQADLFNIKKSKNEKLSVVVSKKYIKKATKRNLLKRRVCYAIKSLEKENLIKNTKQTVYLKKPLTKIPKYKYIKQEICGILL